MCSGSAYYFLVNSNCRNISITLCVNIPSQILGMEWWSPSISRRFICGFSADNKYIVVLTSKGTINHVYSFLPCDPFRSLIRTIPVIVSMLASMLINWMLLHLFFPNSFQGRCCFSLKLYYISHLRTQRGFRLKNKTKHYSVSNPSISCRKDSKASAFSFSFSC